MPFYPYPPGRSYINKETWQATGTEKAGERIKELEADLARAEVRLSRVANPVYVPELEAENDRLTVTLGKQALRIAELEAERNMLRGQWSACQAALLAESERAEGLARELEKLKMDAAGGETRE